MRRAQVGSRTGTLLSPRLGRRLETWAARHVFTHNDGIVYEKYLAARTAGHGQLRGARAATAHQAVACGGHTVVTAPRAARPHGDDSCPALRTRSALFRRPPYRLLPLPERENRSPSASRSVAAASGRRDCAGRSSAVVAAAAVTAVPVKSAGASHSPNQCPRA